MNLTSAFVDICKTTAGLWTSRLLEDQESLREKKRAPFLPFVLRNRTGEGGAVVFSFLIKPTSTLILSVISGSQQGFNVTFPLDVNCNYRAIVTFTNVLNCCQISYFPIVIFHTCRDFLLVLCQVYDC